MLPGMSDCIVVHARQAGEVDLRLTNPQHARSTPSLVTPHPTDSLQWLRTSAGPCLQQCLNDLARPLAWQVLGMCTAAAETGCVRCSASPEQWQLATQAITASCAVTCAHAWLGYIPQGLMKDVQDVLQQLAMHDRLIGMPNHHPHLITSVCA